MKKLKDKCLFAILIVVFYAILIMFSICVINFFIGSFYPDFIVSYKWTLYRTFIAPIANRIAGMTASISGNSSEWIVYVPGAISVTIALYIYLLITCIRRFVIFFPILRNKTLVLFNKKQICYARIILLIICVISYFFVLYNATSFSCEPIFKYIKHCHLGDIQKIVTLSIFFPSFLVAYPIFYFVTEADFNSLILPMISINHMLWLDILLYCGLHIFTPRTMSAVYQQKYYPFFANVVVLSKFAFLRWISVTRKKNTHE